MRAIAPQWVSLPGPEIAMAGRIGVMVVCA